MLARDARERLVDPQDRPERGCKEDPCALPELCNKVPDPDGPRPVH